jgi:hypothetical protein
VRPLARRNPRVQSNRPAPAYAASKSLIELPTIRFADGTREVPAHDIAAADANWEFAGDK